ncbi:MAG: 5-formyltetrahydrofolate cyclo-ligase [Eubacteriales bacterium]|nr:5-formyltetrahydrofolate cyclo-ligase [Eubacteriales bacterium]
MNGEHKIILRREAKAKRQAISIATRSACERQLFRAFDELSCFSGNRSLLSYYSVGSELSLHSSNFYFAQQGCAIYLPRLTAEAGVMEFALQSLDISSLELSEPESARAFLAKFCESSFEREMLRSIYKDLNYAMRIPEPSNSAEIYVEPCDAALVLVPGLYFDRVGRRLGYGGGYYDRYLAKHPALFRLGITFRDCFVETLPCEAHDLPLDALLVLDEADYCYYDFGHKREKTGLF